MTDLPRLEMMLGTEFNECSIAAAELNDRVHELLADPPAVEVRALFLLDGSEIATPQIVQTVTVSEEFQTRDNGRTAQLMIIKRLDSDEETPAYLTAVTRGNVALPLASFARRDGPTCDYVQIGQEMYDHDMVVTVDDEHSRQDFIQAMRDITERPPTRPKNPATFSEELAQIDIFKTKRDVRADIEEESVTSRLSHNRRFSKRGAHLAGVYDGFFTVGEIDNGRIIDAQTLKEQPRKVRTMYGQGRSMSAFYANLPDKEKYLRGNSPEDEIIRKMALIDFLYDKYREMSEASRQDPDFQVPSISEFVGSKSSNAPDETAAAFAALFDVEAQFEERLGKYNADEERIIAISDQLGKGVFRLAEVVSFGRTKAQAEIIVGISGSNATNTVAVNARPAAMGEAEPVDIFRVHANRCAELELSAEESAELASILGKVSLRVSAV